MTKRSIKFVYLLTLLSLFTQACAPGLQNVKEEREIVEAVPASYPAFVSEEPLNADAQIDVLSDAKSSDLKPSDANLEPPPENSEQKISSPVITATQEEKASVEQSWKTFFKDPALASLILTGLENNQDLKMVNQEIKIANNE